MLAALKSVGYGLIGVAMGLAIWHSYTDHQMLHALVGVAHTGHTHAEPAQVIASAANESPDS